MEFYNKNEKDGARVQMLMCDRSIQTELGADFSLPDYQPEIKRLLRVRATVAPPDKYVGAGAAEFSGMVDYNILYAGNDGALYCASQSGEYRFSVPIEASDAFEVGEGILCDVETVPDLTVGRVVAPRRLSLKCRLRSRVRMYGIRLLEEKCAGVPEESLERLMGSVECARVFVGTGEVMQLGDEIVYDAAAENLRVIAAEGQVFVSEASAGSGCVNCRGEVALKLLCCREGSDSTPYLQTRRIPFTGSVPVDGAEVNCDACAYGICSDMSITVEDGRILCEVAMRLEARAQRNERVSYTKDLYSTAVVGTNRYETVAFPVAEKCQNGNFSLNTTLSMAEVGLRPDQNVVDLTLSPIVTGVSCENGKCVLTGKCRAQAILYADGESASQEFEIPFRYESEGGGRPIAAYDATVTPVSCRARVDGERIGIDAELAVSLATRCETCAQVLKETTFGDKAFCADACYTVCYPAKEDTLWSVAKRYHRSVETIASVNPLSGSPVADSVESLDGVRFLLV